MPQKLMDVLMLGRCSHEFSWPRRAANGEYYQVCLVCASAYQYDWKTMRRGNRVDEPMADTWYAGVVQNISQSGILFHGPQQLPANALVELIFEMPEEISGQKNSGVLCQGRLIRTKDAVDKTEDSNELAASILDYKFLHKDRD